MKQRHKRMIFIFCAVIGLTTATLLIANALRQNLVYFHTPSELLALNEPSPERIYQLGGMVKEGSVQREINGTRVTFIVTDMKKEIAVEYTGILPDLFSEGQGIVARGHLTNGNYFVANEVLAKHDEKYMPTKVADALNKP